MLHRVCVRSSCPGRRVSRGFKDCFSRIGCCYEALKQSAECAQTRLKNRQRANVNVWARASRCWAKTQRAPVLVRDDLSKAFVNMHDTLFGPFLVLVKELNQGQEIRELVTGRSEVEAGVIFHSLSEESGRTVCFIEQHLNLRDEEMRGGGQS